MAKKRVHRRPQKNYREIRSIVRFSGKTGKRIHAYSSKKLKDRKERKLHEKPKLKVNESPSKINVKGRLSFLSKKHVPYHPEPRVYSEATTSHLKPESERVISNKEKYTLRAQNEQTGLGYSQKFQNRPAAEKASEQLKEQGYETKIQSPKLQDIES